jgi:hypothetical protein
MRSKRLWLALLALLATSAAMAHIASNGFLTLDVEGNLIHGTLELAVRDGELAVGLDRDGDGRITWGELRSRRRELQAYVLDRLSVGDGVALCAERFRSLAVSERTDGNYIALQFLAECPHRIERLRLDYRLLAGIDPSHRGLLAVTAWGATQTGVLTPGAAPHTLELAHPSVWHAFAEYLQIGVFHIWSGIDHLLFLLSLLLPAVLRRRAGHWEAVPLARPAVLSVLKVVTAFTLAHSITLSLAAFDVIHLPARLTESVIAASIIVAALNNLVPRVTEGRWRIAFAFGLLHGFGFASVLAEMGLPPGARLISLVAFNLGVEVGQLAIVAAVMPLAYTLRASEFYRRTVMQWGSSAIAALALVWLVQRATA